LSLSAFSSAIVSDSTTCLGRFVSPPSGPFTAPAEGTSSRSCSKQKQQKIMQT
jgi:hypothetical protein